MAKINQTSKVKQFLNFVNSEESRKTDLCGQNCLASDTPNEWLEAMARMQADKDMMLAFNEH